MSDTKHKQTIQLIKSLSGQANVLTIPRVFISITGGINAALLLSQCIYWTDKTKDRYGWFFKSYNEWNNEIGLTQYQVNYAAKKLINLKLIQTKKKKAMGAPTMHYKVNFKTLTNLIMKKLDNQETSQSDYEETQQSDYQETSQSLTEITQEITHKTTLTPQQEMVGALAEVTGLDYKITSNAGRLASRGAELLKAGYMPIQVVRHYSSGGWWYENDWRGLKNQKPKPEHILETIKQAVAEARPAPVQHESRTIELPGGEIVEVTS